MDALYQRWLRHVFVRQPDDALSLGENIPDFEAEPEVLLLLVTRTLQRCEEDLAGYSDGQVANGLAFIFDMHFDIMHSIRHSCAGSPAYLELLGALKALYSGCFEKRCQPFPSCCSPVRRELNDFCYMFWDSSALDVLPEGLHAVQIAAVCLDVMAFALTLDNIACIESALHGLGHFHTHHPREVEVIITQYVERAPDSHADILGYARQAALGMVN